MRHAPPRSAALARRVAAFLALAVLLATVLDVAPLAVADVRAAAPDLTLTTDATYSVQPEKTRVHVSLEAVAVSHTHDSVTKRYYFSGTYLTVLPGTANYAATNGSKKLGVHVSKRTKDYVLLSIDFDRRVYSGQTYAFRLQFDLLDPGGPPTRNVRVGSSLVAFPVWAFASAETPGSTVRVVLPEGFEPEPGAGDLPAPSTTAAGEVVYQTGPIAAPLDFYSYLMADRPGAFRETLVNTAVGLRQASVLVKAWSDDPTWGKQVADLFRRGLPLLGGLIGLPYPRTGELMVEEAVSRSLGGYSGLFDPSQGRIQVAYYAEPFVVLHEAAHTWFNSELASDRWIDEAFASYYAKQVATKLGIKITARSLTPTLLKSRIQLNDWGAVGREEPGVEDFAYAATLNLADLIGRRAGPGGLARVWQAAADRDAAYQPLHASSGVVERSSLGAPDWRILLDLLEERTGQSYTDLWRAWVVGAEDGPLLVERSAARDDYRATAVQAGAWELPKTVRDALDTWQFPDVRVQLADARAVLGLRDQVAARARNDGLAEPPMLRRLFETSGGLQAALSEGRRELAALDAIEAAGAAEEAHSRAGVTGEVGLLGRDPAIDLAAAGKAFGAGDLAQAVADARVAQDTWTGAGGVGQVRLAALIGGLLAFLLALAAFLLLRRRRKRQRIPIASTTVPESAALGGGAPRASTVSGADPYATLARDPGTGVAPHPATSGEAQPQQGGSDPR